MYKTNVESNCMIMNSNVLFETDLSKWSNAMAIDKNLQADLK